MTPLQLVVTPPSGVAFSRECSGPCLVMGRSRKADLVIPDRFLSRLHARLVLEGEEWILEDLGSHNPTLLNEHAVSGRTPVRPGDVLRLGSTRVTIGPTAAAASSAPAIQGIFKSALELETQVRSWERNSADEATLRRLTGRLELINEVHRALAEPISREALLDLILDSAFEHLKPEEGAIFLKGASGELYPAASRRHPDVVGEFLCSRSLVREVNEKRMAALVADVGVDDRFAGSESIQFAGVRSLVAAPLLDGDGCLGMIVLNSRLHVRRFSEEDLGLLVSLASAAALRIRNLTLTEQAARHLLLEKELDLAREVQMAMLPREFPRRAEFELAATLKSARAVGGDLYDFVMDERGLWLLVGDVSGKGFPAALLMAVTKTLFRALLQAQASPAAVLTAMNRELARDNESAMFVTAFAACLDLGSGDLRFANAGHNRPYVLGSEGSLLRLDEAAGMALGVVAGQAYAPGHVRLDPGEALYLYTDGVTEAQEPGQAQYTEARLEACLRALCGAPAQGIVEGSLRAVQEFSGEAPQSDDIAILVARYLSRP